MTFGQRFKELRTEKGLKQQELAEDFNKAYDYTFSKSSISQYENDKRKPETKALIDFASYFNVSIDYLIGNSDDRLKVNDVEFKNSDDVKDMFLEFVEDFFKDKNIDREKKDNLFKELSNRYFNSLK